MNFYSCYSIIFNMFDHDAFEIYGKDGGIIAVVSCFNRDLTNKEMGILTEMFNGADNGGCTWLFCDNIEARFKEKVIKDFNEYIENNF